MHRRKCNVHTFTQNFFPMLQVIWVNHWPMYHVKKVVLWGSSSPAWLRAVGELMICMDTHATWSLECDKLRETIRWSSEDDITTFRYCPSGWDTQPLIWWDRIRMNMKLGHLCHMVMLHVLSMVNDFKRICTCHLTTMAACPAGGVPKCMPAIPDWFLNTPPQSENHTLI